MRLGFVYTIITPENKLLLEAARKRGMEVAKLSDAEMALDITARPAEKYDAVLQRSSSYMRSLYSTRYFEQAGVPVVNSYAVQSLCGNKVLTTMRLMEHDVPTPRTLIAFTEEGAMRAIEQLGYPVVMKPVIGSWARLLAKINDREAAQAIIEHKEELGNFIHKVYYLQEYIDKPGRDIRAFTAGEEVLCAIYRNAGKGEWLTNTARGAKASNCPVSDELGEVVAKAARAVGEGLLAVDVMESERGLLVHEVNHTMEFRNSIQPTGVDIPARVIEYVQGIAKK
ncbi:lysine biosynthesis protein LysX [Candidatus Micrarchaeota archaeon]|nr:MAG: lysine biosynthesis protein LysX [Candidatus Micrarchaeota archaeon]